MAMTMTGKAVFLDKDGTLIEDVPHNVDLAKIRLLDGVLQGLKVLHEAGFKLIIVTNQAGVAHGYFDETALARVRHHLTRLLQQAGVPLTGFYYCPHHPEGSRPPFRQACFCRKPKPGLLFRAARDHRLRLDASWLVGDILHDVEAGRRANCRTVLIDNGHETEWQLTALRRPHVSVPDFRSAVKAILAGQIGHSNGRSDECQSAEADRHLPPHPGSGPR